MIKLFLFHLIKNVLEADRKRRSITFFKRSKDYNISKEFSGGKVLNLTALSPSYLAQCSGENGQLNYYKTSLLKIRMDLYCKPIQYCKIISLQLKKKKNLELCFPKNFNLQS